MRNILKSVVFVFIFSGLTIKSFAWGKTGHGLVAEIAFKFLDDTTQQIVKKYLGNLTIEEAASWMDDERGNSYYNFMRPWHYIDLDKDEKFELTRERNILTVLHSAITELRQRKTTGMSDKEIKNRILLIFHLVGDIHQPLHTGYKVDKGGNTIQINSPYVSGNLHSVWDTQILEYKGITLDSCINFYHTMGYDELTQIQQINELKWMMQSRSKLDRVYNFENNFLDKNYIDNNITVIKKQLVIGGIRLAAVLKELFNPGPLKTV